jgi:glutathione S-transferase
MMAGRPIRLYGIRLSHPVLAVRGMLDRKGLAYRYVELLGGMHPPSLLVLGFRGGTVPAIKLPDGRRLQGSLDIAQAVEALAAAPSLYPSDPPARAAAQDAERWGEAVLQPIPRRLIRWGLSHRISQRRWFADVATPLPAPGVNAVLLSPLARVFARQVGANDDGVRHDLAELPGLLDEVDRLIGQGVIGGEDLGAADFQIGATLRVLLAFDDAGGLVAGRPAEALARRVVPDYPDIPAVLPPEWLPTAAGAAD